MSLRSNTGLALCKITEIGKACLQRCVPAPNLLRPCIGASSPKAIGLLGAQVPNSPTPLPPRKSYPWVSHSTKAPGDFTFMLTR